MARTTAARNNRMRAAGIQGPAMGSGTFVPGTGDVKTDGRTERRNEGRTERRNDGTTERRKVRTYGENPAWRRMARRSAPRAPVHLSGLAAVRLCVRAP